MKVGIIGGSGWIGSSLGRALIETGFCSAGDIVILNRAGNVGDFFGYSVRWAKDTAELVAMSDVIVLSVRPQDWRALRIETAGKLVISVMAGVPLRALPPRCIRALPNAAAEFRQSYTPWFGQADITEEDRTRAVAVLGSIGFCEPVETEHHLDLMTATVGAGPAYPALLARAVIAFLVENGVAPEIAARATEGMLSGAVHLLRGRTAEASQMVQRFIDYDGTTAAGLQTALTHGFETALMHGFRAGTERAEQMAKTI